MHFFAAHKWLTGLVIFLLLFIGVVAWQIIYVHVHHGAPVLAPNIPRQTEHLGSAGTSLNYVVMGDSTSIGQGADYSRGIAEHTAFYMAQTHQVALTNVGVSGARVADVLSGQIAKAIALKPDVVLLAIGANDVTHLTNPAAVRDGITTILAKLQAANPNVKVVLTGSPAMGSVPRFAALTQLIARYRTNQINAAITAAVQANNSPQNIVLVPLAEKTAATFLSHPEYFASDNFHPNAEGYTVWFPVLDAGFATVVQ